MYIGSQTPTYGYAKQGGMPAAKADGQAMPSRGERVVARLDQDGDGKLGLGELAEGRIGKKMTVERFARLDGDADGKLSAAEIDAGRTRGRAYGGEDAMKNLVTAKMADAPAPAAPAPLPGEDLAGAIIGKLDSDGNGSVNSEEIAGTWLAQNIGSRFYDLDGDKSGTLDTAELGAFIRTEILKLAEPSAPAAVDPAPAAEEADPSDAAKTVAASVVEEVAEAAEPAPAEESAAVGKVDAEPAGLSPSEQMLKSLETALKVIQDGQETRSTYDVVSALYGDAQKIFAA